MKKLLLIAMLAGSSLAATAQKKEAKPAGPDPSKEVLLVDAACGQCRMDMKGAGCDLAIRLNGKAYFVDGTHIDEHGDAHGEDGFCNAVRKAHVQGTVVNNRFKATYFKLADTAVKKEKTPLP